MHSIHEAGGPWRSWVVSVGLAAICLSGHIARGAETLGPQGINASGLGLTGQGINIGQVEQYRPGVPGFDSPGSANPSVAPTSVFGQSSAALPDTDIDQHATAVAGVMISSDPAIAGVSPGAALHSAAFVATDPAAVIDALQRVATQSDGSVIAINMSFGLPGIPNTYSVLSQGVDWIARQHDVLLVNSGLQDGLENYLPKDAYNNLVVGRLAKDSAGQFDRVSVDNNTLTIPGGRTRPDLLAPGDNISVAKLGGGTTSESGTSFAAPLVTGSVALLGEYVGGEILAQAPRINANALRHEVVKAALLNSANKIADSGNGQLLGMRQTIVDSVGHTWLDSPALTDPAIPLDAELGAGALDVSRAIDQIAGGQWSPNQPVGSIGWDYGVAGGEGQIERYPLGESLRGGSYLAATLVWDRQSVLADSNFNQQYDPGENFFSLDLTNLDLYLVPKGAQSLTDAVWSSTADSTWNIEHLFVPIPQTGEYELWVYQSDAPHGGQTYALAWQARAVPEPASLLLLALGAMAFVEARRGFGQLLGRRVSR